MILRVDTESPIPPYEQIRSQITTMIAAATLTPGARLPTIRQLASDLGLAGGTVARAYRELEQAGLIVSKGRRGTFVLKRASKAKERKRERLSHAARAFAIEAAQLGVGPEDALSAARRAFDEVAPA